MIIRQMFKGYSLHALVVVSFGLAPLSARADAIFFTDSTSPSMILTVSANGFLGSALTLNGNIVLTNGTYVNQTTTFPLGTGVSFKGTDSNFYDPYNFSATYDFIAFAGSTAPEAELRISGVNGAANGNVGSESFVGQFVGYGSSVLPSSITVGSQIVVAPPGQTQTITFGSTNSSMSILVTPVAPAGNTIPEPPSVLILMSALIVFHRFRIKFPSPNIRRP